MSYRGFVDIQTNGWMGTDFCAPSLTVERIREITRDHVARGTIAYVPTLITAPLEVYQRNLPIIAAAMRDPELGGHVLGIHMEGPFLSPEPGAVGAHPKESIRDPSIEIFEKLMKWSDGKICLMTVAPERPGGIDLIRHAVRRGVTVSVGHHLASDEDLQQAVDAGATLCTHLGNGMPNMINRHQNPLWWLLACDDITSLIITDGHHLPADMIKVVVRAKGVDRLVITSDASPLAGMPVGKYTIFSGLPVVIDSTGLIYSEQSKSLAGSHAVALECMNHLASLKLLTEKQLWQVGVLNPLRAVGKTPAALKKLQGPTVTFQKGRFVIKPVKTTVAKRQR